MINHVNTVLIAKTAPASYTNVAGLAVGDVAIFDENKQLITATTGAQSAKAIYIGVVEGTETVYKQDGTSQEEKKIRYSMPIQKCAKPHYVFTAFEAKAEDKIVLTFTNVTPEVGHRYVIRLVYNDIYEHPGQFTHTYEVVATSTTAADLAAAFQKKIAAHKGARVTASVSTAVLTLTAKEIPYDQGVTLDSGYMQVSMEAFAWTTIPSGLLSNVTYPIAGLTIAKTTGTPGHGNPYIVRDREEAAWGYMGITHRDQAYPYIHPEYQSDLSAEYDTVTIEWDNLYRSNDNQYIKTTPLATELYINEGEFSGSVAEDIIEAFVA